MSTIDNKDLIDKLIASDGYFENDPRVYLIVEYENFYGNTTWGVTWSDEMFSSRLRYLNETDYIKHPKVIWSSDPNRVKVNKA